MKLKSTIIAGVAVVLFTVGFGTVSNAQKSTTTDSKSSTEKKGNTTTKKSSKKTVTKKEDAKKKTIDTKTSTNTDKKVETTK
jgi:hypothetical protein